jgi:hypothetical protein
MFLTVPSVNTTGVPASKQPIVGSSPANQPFLYVCVKSCLKLRLSSIVVFGL